jgi:hypothetical protein
VGLLTRGSNLLGDLGRQVPAGSKRDRVINALAGGIEETQNLLAGKYAAKLPKALSFVNTAQYAPVAYGLISAGGSVAGNVLSGEEKDPGRILTEAAGAGALGALGGAAIRGRAFSSNAARLNYPDIAKSYGEAALPYINRGVKAAEAGATATAEAAFNKATAYGDKVLAAQKQMADKINANRRVQGAYIATIPVAAGLGGMAGGAVSNIAQMAGIPGFQAQQQYVDPESYGSSNTMGALATTDGSRTTLRYM